jgi:guanine nucleotide-binding protein G(I)/G(S)/G(T) subunit beta-1
LKDQSSSKLIRGKCIPIHSEIEGSLLIHSFHFSHISPPPPKKVANLKSKIDLLRKEKMDKTMTDVVKEKGTVRDIRRPPSIKLRRALKGHFGKVYAMHWAGDSESLLSASQDGKMIVWNAMTNVKTHAISLRSSWVMTCAFEQKKGKLVACGGLDNICSIYDLSQSNQSTVLQELQAHDGYLSCCRFVDEKTILTSSGDSTCIHWDITRGEVLHTFKDHTGDVMSLSISPSDPNIFVSGSVDTTARVWDLRTGTNVQTHVGHDADINSCDFFPNGQAFGTGSDDSTCRIFDLRCYGEVNKFSMPDINCGITSVSFSKSGRLLFSGMDDFSVHAWDVLSPGDTHAFALPSPHDNRVSCLGINPNGSALCTGSWDFVLKVWA